MNDMNDPSTVISSVGLGILGDEDILKKSVATIYKTTLNEEPGSVYDPALGCSSNDSKCVTCGGNVFTCPGHFGHINLNVPIILFYKHVTALVKCFCLNCNRLICTADELALNGLLNDKLRNVVGYSQLVDYVGNQTMCAHCRNEQPTVRLKDCVITATYCKQKVKRSVELTPTIIKHLFDNVDDRDAALLGVDLARFHPKNLVLTKFPVLPVTCRPKMEISTSTSDDDLTLLLIDIIKNNNNAEKNGDNDDNDNTSDKTNGDKKREAYAKAVANIKLKTLAYCDNSKGLAVHNTNHKPMTGVKDRLTTKTGLIRQNINGKRCEKTARTVVGPDSTLRVDEVGVPIEIARSLTICERVNEHNIRQLTKIVNDGNAKFIIRRDNKTKIDVSRARVRRGTLIQHGDVIVRDGQKIVVKDCKMPLVDGDVVIDRVTGCEKPIERPTTKLVDLRVGDKVERYLRDGDAVMLNRQPTLHRNSILGMKIVVKPAKTLRVPLALTPGFNMDFDGDEGNIYLMDSQLSRAEILNLASATQNLVSMQSSKPNVFLVQDSLLGAYLMTNERRILSRRLFYDCLCKTDALVAYPDVERRRKIAIDARREPDDDYVAWQLFAFILPASLTYEKNGLVVKNGVIVDGCLDKTSLKNAQSSLLVVMSSVYGSSVTKTFIENVQFLTCAWLETNNFSIGIGDCLISRDVKRDVKTTAAKYFAEADRVVETTDNADIREYRVQMELNKAKDLGSTIAKNAFRSGNNFVTMIESGSKGDYFNIVQITGLLGQQNVVGKRTARNLNDGNRSMVHDSFLVTDSRQKYENRGFVSSSFIDGLNFREMFYHSMSGRDGMINTAMATAVSGYQQRQLIKLLEDMRIGYDGSVRGANGNVYEYVYGNHGYDPSKIFRYNARYGVPELIDVATLADIVSGKFPTVRRRKLRRIEIEEIVVGCQWYPRDAVGLIPRRVYESVWRKYEAYFYGELSTVYVADSIRAVDEFIKTIRERYAVCKITPGENVGIIAAQSIGERQTQTNLDTFHTAGKLQEKKIGRLEEISTLTKTVRNKSNTVLKMRRRYSSSRQLRDDLNCSLVGVKFKSIVSARRDDLSGRVEYALNDKKCFAQRLTSTMIRTALRALFPTSYVEASSSTSIVTDIASSALDEAYVCGIPAITAMHLDYSDGDGWYVVTEGCDYQRLLAHPLVDGTRLYTNDFWQVYETLGIAAFKEYLLKEFDVLLPGIHACHYRLIASRMTNLGRPASITRYTMRDSDVGPLSKATFEECVDVLINAAVRTETERNKGISAALMCANRPKCGTGAFDLNVDLDWIRKNCPV